MEMNGAVASSAILVMGLVGLFSVALPLGLALLFRRRTGGRTRFFLLGCVVFPLFAMGLEAQGHRLLYYGVWSQALNSSIWLYALYGGLMAGIFGGVRPLGGLPAGPAVDSGSRRRPDVWGGPRRGGVIPPLGNDHGQQCHSVPDHQPGRPASGGGADRPHSRSWYGGYHLSCCYPRRTLPLGGLRADHSDGGTDRPVGTGVRRRYQEERLVLVPCRHSAPRRGGRHRCGSRGLPAYSGYRGAAGSMAAALALLARRVYLQEKWKKS